MGVFSSHKTGREEGGGMEGGGRGGRREDVV